MLVAEFAADFGARTAVKLYADTRRDLESRRAEFDPHAAQLVVLSRLSETVAALGTKVQEIAARPTVIQNVVEVPQQPAPVVKVDVPPGPAPIINVPEGAIRVDVKLPERKAAPKVIEFEKDKQGNITGAKVKAG
jgi:hypothetical protein